MKTIISIDEYGKLPVYLHSCYHQKRRDGEYYLSPINAYNIKSMVFEMANNKTWAEFFIWVDENKIELKKLYK